MHLSIDYQDNCMKCSNEGTLKNGEFCDCSVGISESLMGISAEVDELIEKDRGELGFI